MKMELFNEILCMKSKEELIKYIKRVYLSRGEQGKKDLKRDLHKVKLIICGLRIGRWILLISSVCLIIIPILKKGED